MILRLRINEQEDMKIHAMRQRSLRKTEQK